MQARFYVPWFGRFASPDPARDQHFEDTQSWNIYSYVRNSPIMSTDPTGMETEEEKKANGLRPGPNDRPYIAASEVLAQPKAQTNQNGVVVDGGSVKGQFSVDRLNPSNNPDDKTTGRAIFAEGEAGAKGASAEVGIAKGDAKLVESKHFDLSFSTAALTAEGQATLKPSKQGDASGKNDKQGTLGVGVSLGATATIAKAQFTATIKLGPLHLNLKAGFTAGVEAGLKGGSKGIGADVGAILKLGAGLSWGN